jgi:hypothetical protein
VIRAIPTPKQGVEGAAATAEQRAVRRAECPSRRA